MPFRIKVVVENTCYYPELMAEHGLSLWIESDDLNILFDTGQSGTVLQNNIDILGMDLSKLSCIVLSHGHYDHCAGLKFLSVSKSIVSKIPIFAHPYILRPKFKRCPLGKRNIGVDSGVWEQVEKKFLLNFGFSTIKLAESTFCLRGMDFNSEIDKRFVLSDNSVDEFLDETYLLLVSRQGGILVSGCGHRGVENVIRWVIDNLGIMVIAIVGGLHMTGDDKLTYRRRASVLYGLGVKEIYPMHCVSFTAKCAIREGFAGKINVVGVGDEIVFS